MPAFIKSEKILLADRDPEALVQNVQVARGETSLRDDVHGSNGLTAGTSIFH
jgi:hypothetical protein